MLKRLSLAALCLTPMIIAATYQGEPTSDQVFKNIKVFKGVPASDLIPAMEFMAASLKYECADCHDMKDFATDTRTKETARRMILMQRDINEKNFGGKLEVTCNSCHGGKEHPAGTPIPEGLKMRHERMANAPKPESLFDRHLAASGEGTIIRKGTLTAPNPQTMKVETKPVELTQDATDKFKISGATEVLSDGKDAWYYGQKMDGEGIANFSRVGRSWRNKANFSGLQKATITGTEKIGKEEMIVVRASRPATESTEELYFDKKTGLLRRLVNVRRSTLGSVISMIDYSDYKAVGGIQVPMKVVTTFPGDNVWAMTFTSATKVAPLPGSAFQPAK